MSKAAIYLSVVFVLGVSVLGFLYFKGRGTAKMTRDEKALIELTSLEAYNQYYQGRNYWNKQDERSIRKGIEYFNAAIRLDTGLAAAYSGVADCYAALGYGSYEPPDSAFKKAEVAARRAIELDPLLADAHTSLGYVQFYYHWDWPAAEREFTKAVQANANYDPVFDSYTYFLTAMGRFPEAGIAIDKALQINPLSARLNGDKGFFLYYSGQYPEAIAFLKEAIANNPKSPIAHLWMGRSYEELKEYKEAAEEFRSVLRVNPNWPVALAALGYVYGVSGQRQEAQAVLDTLLALGHERYVTPYGIALVYAALDDKDKAFEWLEKAYSGRSNWLVWLKLDPRWAKIRDDRRYAELMQRIGLVRERGAL